MSCARGVGVSAKSCNHVGACCKGHKRGMTCGLKARATRVALLYKAQAVDDERN